MKITIHFAQMFMKSNAQRKSVIIFEVIVVTFNEISQKS